MTDAPRVLFVLYYKSPPHTDQLIKRGYDELKGLERLDYPSQGPPSVTLNAMLKDIQRSDTQDWDWVVPYDPHLQWTGDGAKAFLSILNEVPDRCGAIEYPVHQHGPQTDGWAPFLKEQPVVTWLLPAFKVSALKKCGGFHGAPSGRNWVPATVMKITDQGYTVKWVQKGDLEAAGFTGRFVACHDDPILTMKYQLSSAFMGGRDWAQLWDANRGHPYLTEPGQVTQDLYLVEKLTDVQKAKVYYLALKYARLLGVIEGKGCIPKDTIPSMQLEVRLDAE